MTDTPLKTVEVKAGKRVYYFDLRQDKTGQHYMTATEIDAAGKRQCLFVHADYIDGFIKAAAEMRALMGNGEK